MDLADDAVCRDHGFFQSGIDQVNFFGAAYQIIFIFGRNRFSDHLLDGADQLLTLDLFKMFLQPAEPHMGKVLSPFEV